MKTLLLKKGILLTLAVCVLMSFALNAESAESKSSDLNQAKAPKFLTIGTANTGGAYYPIGIAMADLLTNKLNIQTTAQTTGGAVENNLLVNSGKADLAITQGSLAYSALNGEDPYKQKMQNLSLMFSGLSKGVYHLIVNENSPIKSFQDLKGKKVVLGPPGGAGITMPMDVLSVHGMKPNDIKSVYVSYDDGADGMTDGNYDAVVVQSAVPAPAIFQLTASKKPIRLISLDEEAISKLLKKFPYYARMEIPKTVYNTKQNVNTIYVSNVVVVNRLLSEDLVYSMTKLFFENIDRITASHPSAKELTVQNAVTAMPIPMHPGAAKYFKERKVK